MTSLFDAFNDSIGEEYAFLKYVVYAFPVYFCVKLYLSGNFVLFYLVAVPVFLLFLALLSNGVNNVRKNRKEILTFNFFKIIHILFIGFIALAPTFLILFIIAYCLVSFVNLPFDISYLQLIFKCVVWLIVGSVALTAFLSFSKNMNIKSAYNFPIIFESCIDVLIDILFLIPQLVIMNGLIVGVVWYLFFYFKIPLTNPAFLFYCSVVFVFNISVLSGYFSQSAYEFIRGNDEEYRDNYYIKNSAAYKCSKKK